MTEKDGFRMLVEGLPEPVARLAPDLRIAYVNEALCARFAKSREALIGRSVLTLVPESDRESLAQHLASLDAEHPVGRFESSGVPSGEEPGGLLWIIRAVHNDEENLLEYQALVHDRGGARNDTNHENADGPLARIEKSFRSIVHNSSEIVKIVDLEGTLRYVSPAFGRILGYNPELAIGTNLLEYVHPEDLPHVLEETERASNGAGTASSKAEYRFKHKDGSWRWLESVGTYLLDDPMVRGVLINVRDVTERKEAEEALERLACRNELILNSAGEGIYGLDEEGNTTFVNPAAARLTGFVPEELLRKPLHDIIHHSRPDGMPYPEEECPIYAALTDGEVHRVEDEVFWRKDGSSFPVEYTSTPILEGGEVTGAVVTFTDITGRKEAEAASKRSEEHLRSLIRKVSDIVTLYEADGTIRYTSPALRHVLGYEPEDRIDGHVLDLVHPEDVARVRSAFADILRQPNATISMEVRVRHRDGSWRYLEAVGTNLLDDPSVGAVVLNAKDVTERKEAEEGLKKAERLYRTLVEQIPAVTYVDRADGTDEPVYTSPRIEEMLGYTPEEWISGLLWSECLHPDDRERVLTADESFEAGDGPFSEEYRLIARDGSVVWVREEAELVSDEEGRPLYWQGVMLDITESKDAEEAVRESERRFRSLIRNASDIVMVVGEDGRVRYISPAVERVLGYRPDWVEGRDAFEIVHPEDLDHVRGSVDRLADESQEAITMEVRLRHTDGSWRHMESVATNLLDDPAIRGVVVNSRDITERKKYEDALRRSEGNLAEAQRMASLGNWEHDYSKDETYWSDELYRVLGIVPGEVEPSWEAFLERIHPDDRDGVRQASQEALRNGGQDTTECRVVRPDGGTRVMQNRREVVLGPDGRPLRVAGTVQDVTEQREADLALREAEERYRTLVERVPAITFVQAQEPEGRSFTTYVSPQVETILGYSPDEWTGDPEFWRKVLHPDDRERFLAENRRLGEAGESLNTDFRMFAKDGRRVVWLRQSSTLLRGGDGQRQVWHGVMLDITELKQVEEDLRGAEERFRSLVEQVPPIIYVQEPKPGEVATYRTTYISPRVRKVLGYSPSHFQEDTAFWESRIHPEDLERVVAENARTDETGEPFEIEYRMIHHDGRTVWVRDEAVLFRDEPHGPVYWQGVISDVTERKDLEEELERRAFHDPLTNLPNRALFADRLAGALERTRRRGKKVAVLFMDLNGFKVVNDSLGHRAGDLLLVIVGERLRRSLRPEDALARFGGDEFVVLLEDVEGPDDAARVAERIMDELRRPFAIDDQALFATASIGIALGDARTSTPEDLLRNADTAMYRAKEDKAGYQQYDPTMHDQVVRRLKLQNDLRRAAEAGEFVVHYQPIVDLRTGAVWGTEALMRWNHPERGLLGPSQFMSVAEDNGLISPMGEELLEEACGQTRRWQEDHRTPSLAVSVNLSAEQLRPGLPQSIEEALLKTGLGADRLILDVAESTYPMLEDKTALSNRLKALGVRLSIDDFGVGYSSLFHLKRLPADILKVDEVLVRGIGEDPEDMAILRMVVELAHTLGMKVVAEGVEDAAQLVQLQEINCDLAQGFYFCGPRSAQELSPLLGLGRLF